MVDAVHPDAGVAEAEARFRAEQARKRLRSLLLPVVGIGGFIALWAGIVYGFGVRPFIAPTPVAVVQTLIENFPMLMTNMMWTAIEALAGFALGNIAGIALAVAFVHSRALEETVFPVTVLINTIPSLAKAPILVLMLGNGIEPKIATAALICFFPTLVNMVRGLQDVNPQALELMRVLSASRTEVFFKLRLYNSLPYLFSALKIATSTATIGALVGEWVGTTVGIGNIIIQAQYSFDSAMLYAAVIVTSVFAVLFFLLIALLEWLFVRWQPVTGGH